MRPHIKQLLPNGKRQLRCVADVVSWWAWAMGYGYWWDILALLYPGWTNSRGLCFPFYFFFVFLPSTILPKQDMPARLQRGLLGKAFSPFFRVSASAAIYVYK